MKEDINSMYETVEKNLIKWNLIFVCGKSLNECNRCLLVIDKFRLINPSMKFFFIEYFFESCDNIYK